MLQERKALKAGLKGALQERKAFVPEQTGGSADLMGGLSGRRDGLPGRKDGQTE